MEPAQGASRFTVSPWCPFGAMFTMGSSCIGAWLGGGTEGEMLVAGGIGLVAGACVSGILPRLCRRREDMNLLLRV